MLLAAAGFLCQLQEPHGEVLPALGVAGDQQHGVVTGDGSQDGRHDRVVDGQGQEVGCARRGPEHGDVGRGLRRDQQLAAQPGKARITAILTGESVRSQAELAALLADDGVQVTQATLSRDLVELGAVRVRGKEGVLVYAVPGEGGERAAKSGVSQEILDARLARLCSDLLVTAEASANIAVLRTPPGAANFLALAIDHSVMPSLLGTIAGDDTVLLVSRDPVGGQDLAARFLQLAEEAGGSQQ